MRLAILELPARFDAFDAALADARALALASPSDLVLLPECALTGYVSAEGRADLSRFAEDASGRTLKALAQLARDAGTHVAGPWIERDGDVLYNAFVVFDPEGRRVARYRKRHPWFPEQWATAGELPLPRLTVAGVRLTLAICYDVHFLSRESAAELDASDVLLFPSAWVDDGPTDLRGAIFSRLASRHAISIANANWGLGAPRLRGQGASRFVTPDGSAQMLEASRGRPARLDVEVRHRL